MKSTKSLNFNELKNMDIKDLYNLLKEKKLLLFNLRIKLKTMQLKNYNEISFIKKDIARISTVISSKKGSL